MCWKTKSFGINNQNHPHETFHICKKIVPTIAKIIQSQVIEAIVMWTNLVCTIHGENVFHVLFKRKEMLRTDMRKFLWIFLEMDLRCERALLAMT